MSGILPFCEDGEATLHSFKDDDLGFALGWKYNNESGIRTYDGQIILSEDMGLHGWPSSLGEIPSEIKLKEICDNYHAEYDAQEYARNRKIEYDALNQFELLSDDAVNGTTTYKNAITAIKDKYPKPE